MTETAKCQNCARRWEASFLCPDCQSDLQELLEGLACGTLLEGGRRSRPLLTSLQDAAHGATRLGVSVRRSSDLSSPVPFNAKASALCDDIHQRLAHWCEVVSGQAEHLAVEEKA